jgi:hypothetical protein
MNKLNIFYETLETYRKPKSDDPYEDRTTHCYLEYIHEGKPHTFEVRGWSKIKDGILNISVVNWTLCAGTATIYMNEDIVDGYRIKEDYA